jgi:hypothetical protein
MAGAHTRAIGAPRALFTLGFLSLVELDLRKKQQK